MIIVDDCPVEIAGPRAESPAAEEQRYRRSGSNSGSAEPDPKLPVLRTGIGEGEKPCRLRQDFRASCQSGVEVDEVLEGEDEFFEGGGRLQEGCCWCAASSIIG